MNLVLETLAATICALGLFLFFWWLLGRTLRPVPEQAVRIVLAGRGDGADLKMTIRGFIYLRSLGLLNCPIMIVDIDLTPDGYETARRLTAHWPGVQLCSAQETIGMRMHITKE